MEKVLNQKRGFNKRNYTLLEDRILVELKSLKKNEKFDVMLERLGYNIRYQADSTIVGKIAFAICILIPTIMLIVYFLRDDVKLVSIIIPIIVFYGLALLNVLKQSQDDVFLSGGDYNLVFFRTIPNEEVVLKFINEIIITSKKYVKNKYTRIDKAIPTDLFYARINWLLENQIISENESKTIIQEYDLQKLI